MLIVVILIGFMNYIDRVNISIAGSFLMQAYGFDLVSLGVIISSFFWGYSIFMLPAGWILQRWGPRRVLTITLILWGVFTALTAVAGNARMLFGDAIIGFLIIRVLLGMTEAFSLPGTTLINSRWAPRSERGRFQSINLASLMAAAAVTPLIITGMMVSFGWPSAFYISAILSVLVAMLVWLIVRDYPRQAKRVSSEELELIEKGKTPPPRAPWRAILRNRCMWFLAAGYGCQGFVAGVFITFFFLYVNVVRHVPLVSSAFLSTLPPIVEMIMGPVAGIISDRLLKSHSITFSRRAVAMGGMFAAGALTAIGGFTVDVYEAVVILAGGAGFFWFATSMWWTAAADLGGEYSGAVSSIMNTFAGAMSFVSPIVFPLIGTYYGYGVSLTVIGSAAVLAGLLWLGVNLETPIGAQKTPVPTP
jgi:ACS family glucarate transporter-like MFS transporter